MTNQSTIDKLIEMRLSSMADAFQIQMNDTTMKEVPFEDRSVCWLMLNIRIVKTIA